MTENAERIELNGEDLTFASGGWDLLDEGARYYNEAMSHQASEEHEERIKCFKAAEECYLKAALLHNNPIAFLDLGYVYSYDRCEGDYALTKHGFFEWATGSAEGDAAEQPAGSWKLSKEQLDFAACICFENAAKAGDPEGMYKYGDMLRDGRGCEADPQEALAWFKKAYEASEGEEPVLWGSAALRLGGCYEEGIGCVRNVKEAAQWYEVADAGLEAAVNAGDWFYKRALKRAADGARRMRQELSGEY